MTAGATGENTDFGSDDTPRGVDAPIDWRRYLHAVQRRWWVVVVSVVVVGLVVGAYTVRQPRLFTSSASLIVDFRTPQVLAGINDMFDGPGMASPTSAMTEYEVMQSRAVARAAALRLGIGETAGADPADAVRGRYSVEPQKGTNVVRIAVVDESPQFAADLANAVADAYLDVALARRSDGSKSASDWLVIQNDELRQKLRRSEDALIKFMSDNGVLNASLESQLDEVKQRLAAFNGQLAIEEANRIRDVLNVEALEQVRADPALIDTLPEVQSASVVGALKQRLIELRTTEMELSSRYLPDHPKMKLVGDQRISVEEELKREVNALLTSMERQKASRDASIGGLRAALDDERKKEARLNNLALEYGRLKRERDTDMNLFTLVTSRLKEADIAGAQPFSTVRFLDRALVPKLPFKPDVRQMVVLALLAGVLVGVAICLLLELLDNTVKSQADLELLVDAPFLGMLPLIPVNGVVQTADRAQQLKQTRERDLYIIGNPRSAVAECSRFIRTNLLFMSPDRPLRTLVITSPSPQEGKSTTGIMTAISMAQAGSRTLIVDTDLRKPRLHRVFGVDSDVGISTVLLGEATLEMAIKSTEVPNLDVLVCGALPPNPAEILLSERFRELVQDLASRYERVIFDTPPIGPVTDPAILGTLVDGVVVVTKCDRTTKESVRQAMRSLRDANVRVFGVILNDVDITAKRYSGAYYAYYRRYGGYYGESAEAEGS